MEQQAPTSRHSSIRCFSLLRVPVRPSLQACRWGGVGRGAAQPPAARGCSSCSPFGRPSGESTQTGGMMGTSQASSCRASHAGWRRRLRSPVAVLAARLGLDVGEQVSLDRHTRLGPRPVGIQAAARVGRENKSRGECLKQQACCGRPSAACHASSLPSSKCILGGGVAEVPGSLAQARRHAPAAPHYHHNPHLDPNPTPLGPTPLAHTHVIAGLDLALPQVEGVLSPLCTRFVRHSSTGRYM